MIGYEFYDGSLTHVPHFINSQKNRTLPSIQRGQFINMALDDSSQFEK